MRGRTSARPYERKCTVAGAIDAFKANRGVRQPTAKANDANAGAHEALAGIANTFRMGATTAANVAGNMFGVPGAGSIVSGLLGGGAGMGTLGGMGGVGGMMGGGDGFSEQLALIGLQQQMQRQTQVVETMSNISKAEHDARMAAVRNIRS